MSIDKNKLKIKILDFFKAHPNKYFGAARIDARLDLDRGHNSWPTHGILLELKKEGFLEQKPGSGFKLTQSTEEN